MPCPQSPDKYDEPAVVTPRESVPDDETPPPDRIALVYDDALLAHVNEAYETSAFSVFGDGRRLRGLDESIGVVRAPGVGAPTAARTMEDLVARGAETFVSVGLAGSLQPDLGPGAFVVVDRALRDEGTSYHYVEPDPFVDADGVVRRALADALDDHGATYHVGPTWTTDAPYRETGLEVERYRDRGVLAVDMEAAATFAVAAYRDVAAGALFTVSDILDPDGWEPRFAATGPALERALSYAIDALRELDGDLGSGPGRASS